MGAGAGATPNLVRDWGLHREWRVECDAAHPQRPARLVEVPWSEVRAAPGHASAERKRVAAEPPAVRAGMRVMVVRRGAMADIRLRGTALGTARTGARVTVRAEQGHSVVEGIVRGPGLVELSGEKMR